MQTGIFTIRQRSICRNAPWFTYELRTSYFALNTIVSNRSLCKSVCLCIFFCWYIFHCYRHKINLFDYKDTVFLPISASSVLFSALKGGSKNSVFRVLLFWNVICTLSKVSFWKFVRSHSPLCSLTNFQKYTSDSAQIPISELLEPPLSWCLKRLYL